MAHQVSFIVPDRPLGKVDIEFKVKSNDELLGTLKISKGAVVWVPKKAKNGYRVGWASFANIMEESGTKGKW